MHRQAIGYAPALLLSCLLITVISPIRLDAAEVANTNVETPSEDSANPDELGTAESQSFGRREALVASITIFVLAIFVGFEVITKVPPTLHTPLMSGSNAISGITLVGAILAAGTAAWNGAAWIGLLAVIFATMNVVGGFLVTHRMLSMFKKR